MDRALPEIKLPRARQAFVLGWPYTNLGGVNAVVRSLVREFSNSGPLAPLVMEVVPSSVHGASLDELPLLRIDLLPPYDARRPWRSFLSFCVHLGPHLWRLRRICRTERIKVLNPHFIGLTHFALMLFRRTVWRKGKLVFSFHGSDLRAMMQSRGLERLLLRLLVRGADRLVACSEGLADELRAFAPECAGRITAIHNGINIDSFVGSADPQFRLPEHFSTRTKLVSVGAFEAKKAHEVLIRAFAQVRRARPDAALIIAGQAGAQLAATRQLVRELGLESDVHLLVDIPHPHIAALLQTANVFVLSSQWEKGVCGEGFAIALLEAAAARIPVVSTESCGVRELITHGESGLLVPPGRPELLAEAVQALLADPNEAARQAANLHDKARRQFTWQSAHRQYLALVGMSDTEIASRACPLNEYGRKTAHRTSAAVPAWPSPDG
ncbi:MAG: glycosyltransferase family 4 protein [Acidobacteriaceae bacterium]|nr:glycosyltransferase family 4 protein [Acidobacteriaceae bacterium]